MRLNWCRNTTCAGPPPLSGTRYSHLRFEQRGPECRVAYDAGENRACPRCLPRNRSRRAAGSMPRAPRCTRCRGPGSSATGSIPADTSSAARSHRSVSGSSVRDQRPQPDHEADDADDHEDEAHGADVDASQAHRYGELQDRPDGDGEKRDSDTTRAPSRARRTLSRSSILGRTQSVAWGEAMGGDCAVQEVRDLFARPGVDGGNKPDEMKIPPCLHVGSSRAIGISGGDGSRITQTNGRRPRSSRRELLRL